MSHLKTVRSALIMLAFGGLIAGCSSNQPGPAADQGATAADGLKNVTGSKISLAPITAKSVRDSQGRVVALSDAASVPAGLGIVDRAIITRVGVVGSTGDLGMKTTIALRDTSGSNLQFSGTKLDSLAVSGQYPEILGASAMSEGGFIRSLTVSLADGRSVILVFGPEQAQKQEQKQAQEQKQEQKQIQKQEQPKQEMPKQEMTKQEQPKQEAKQEQKQEQKQEAKQEQKQEQKQEAKQEQKQEQKQEAKQEQKQEQKQEAKQEQKQEQKQEAKQEQKQEQKQEAKQEQKQEQKQEAKQEQKQEQPKQEIAKQEQKQEAKQEQKQEQKQEAKQEQKQEQPKQDMPKQEQPKQSGSFNALNF